MPCSEETKNKIRASHKAHRVSVGINNPMYGTVGGFYGKSHSEETKEKMRKAALARSKEISIKNKNSAIRSWKDPEIRAKRAAALRKPVLNIDTGEVFDSVKVANQQYGSTHISECCRGIRKTACGYHWKFI